MQGNITSPFEVSPDGFNEYCLKTFRYQAQNNSIFKEYLNHLNINPEKVSSIDDIVFLPVSFFKSHKIVCFEGEAELCFESSGTTGTHLSRHYVKDESIYLESILRGFQITYGDARQYSILALMPSTRQKKHSSLVFMLDSLIRYSEKPGSGFYNDFKTLSKALKRLSNDGSKFILFGLASLLLELARQFPITLGESGMIIETGGMKGQREELTREELHQYLRNAFRTESIHSEYGMTELLSQAYSIEDGVFRSPPWMKVVIRDIYDPLRAKKSLPYLKAGH